MIDRNWIGRSLGDAVLPIEAGRMRFFAKAIGETNSAYFNEVAAREAGYASLPCPPTFLFASTLESGVLFRMLDDMGVPIGKILHGEQSFEYLAPVVAGDVITVASTVGDIFDKKNGALEFVNLDQEAVNQDGVPVARMRISIVIRN